MTSALDILIVDDNPLEAELVAATLREALQACRIVLLSNGDSALAHCADAAFDCIFIDYNMPAMDGLELGRRMSAFLPYTPLILMTAVGDEMLVASALRNGFTDYIPKHRINRESAERAVTRSVRAAKQARTIAEQREELEHFAYALAHDFKQPIRQIRIFAEMLAEDLAIDEASEAGRRLDFLGLAAQRLSALVDVMSQYTLLNRPPELSDVELGRVVDTVRQGLEAFIRERNGVLIAEGLGWVRGNEALLTQILQNLVVNGLRYNTSAQPSVTVAAEDPEESCRRLIVRDNGIGIEAKHLGEIFRPLVRLHTAAEYPGTGLGLTITRKAVSAMGGRIWCASEPGRGSTFYVELPSAQAPVQSGKAA